MLKHGILGLLNYHHLSGYDIMEVFRDSLNYFWKAQTSQIYRELHGLEQRGWVSKTPVPQNGKPDKNIYSITPDGKEELLRWLYTDAELDTKTPLLMKIFFLGERSPEENIRYFRDFKEICEKFLESLAPVPQSIAYYSSLIDQKEKAAYWQMTVEYGRRNMQMQIAWAQECIERLEKMK